MKPAQLTLLPKLFLLVTAITLINCNSTPKPTVPVNTVRGYNGTASVGDFLTISIDASAKTITYKNYTNSETGTVSYSVNSDGTYAITDPNGNLLAGYEVPGTAMMVEAANAGPNRDTAALITAVESAPATINTFAGRNFNYIQFRTTSGGIELGTVSVDSNGNITHAGYWPFGMISQGGSFNSGNFPASSVTEDASGNFFTITEGNSAQDYVFGTQNGFFAVDTGNGTILGLPKAASKAFSPATAGIYTALYYEKPNAQMQAGNVESGTAAEGIASITIGSGGAVTITDSHNNPMASGTLAAVADTSYLYDGTANTLPDPLYGMFTFRTATANAQQDVYVSFQGNAVIFSSFQTVLPIVQNNTYTYFYGVGLK
ncbi:MAG TPA: hypothetical protein VND65_12470 [Candidatus Binatia bacterium]|nr:hypothetical protein [Candidatus Binatia bacterium]